MGHFFILPEDNFPARLILPYLLRSCLFVFIITMQYLRAQALSICLFNLKKNYIVILSALVLEFPLSFLC